VARATQEEIKPGDVLGGKYRIERVIGRGGMGVVAAARHTELHQRVAIKVLPTHLASDKDLVERFMREARAAARLRSEHAVKVVDVGARANGSPFIVMELLDGEDLGALSERGPLPIPDAVDFILQACEAVAEAHALGIVHRDLKPRNLFLTAKLHGKPLVKVLDFGLAKRVNRQDRQLTATAAVMGSPQYMSPEQMRAARDIDFRTDVWSLGVCLYELISSRVPFDAGAVPVLCAMVLKDDPVPLPSVRPDVPLHLWAIIQKCLMKLPAHRFTTVSELAAALEPFAPAHAQGAAARIAAVLHAVPLQGSDAPEPFVRHDADADTRIAAAFESGPRGERGSLTMWLLGGAVGGFVLLAVVGGFLIVQSTRKQPPREAATYAPEIAELGAPSATPRGKAPEASTTSTASAPTGGAGGGASTGARGVRGVTGTGGATGRSASPTKPPDNPNAQF
jgi:serine/threonine-protein kinase